MIFFISVGDTGQINTAVDFNQYMPAKPNCNLTFQPITVDITSRIIDSLKPKTSTGVDCISNIYVCMICIFFYIEYLLFIY